MVAEATDDQCPCGELKYEGIFMIACDGCKQWFHGDCCDVTEYEAHMIDKFFCKDCKPKRGPVIYKKETNAHRHDASEPNAQGKAVQNGTPAFIEDLQSRDFSDGEGLVSHLRGQQLDVAYLNQNGVDRPILVKDKDGLDLKVPSAKFSAPRDVEKLVGSDKVVDVIDSKRQTSMKMTLRDLTKYYESGNRDAILNCISLEVSNSKLGKQIQSPYIVQKLSWGETIWPEEKRMDPEFEVAKYCLISAKDSYTDFHIDFGGSTVWYHIHQGEKVFYFVRPTKSNFAAYKKWMSSANQLETFFGDLADACYKVTVRRGSTLFIPSGWIHAVWSPVDSLVFGGNFIHSHSIPMQLQVYEYEKRAATLPKFCYPHFETLHWFAAIQLLKDYQEWKEENKVTSGGRRKAAAAFCIPPFYMMRGLKALSVTLKNWINASSKSNSPSARREPIPIDEPEKLVKDLTKEVKALEKELGEIALEEEDPDPPALTQTVKEDTPSPAKSGNKQPVKPAAKKTPPKKRKTARRNYADEGSSSDDELLEYEPKPSSSRGHARNPPRDPSPPAKKAPVKASKLKAKDKRASAVKVEPKPSPPRKRKADEYEFEDDDEDDEESPPLKKTKTAVKKKAVKTKSPKMDSSDDEDVKPATKKTPKAKAATKASKKAAKPKKQSPKTNQKIAEEEKVKEEEMKSADEFDTDDMKTEPSEESMDSDTELTAEPEAIEQADGSELLGLLAKAAKLKRTVQPIKLALTQAVKLAPALLSHLEGSNEEPPKKKKPTKDASKKTKPKSKSKKSKASSSGSLVMRISKQSLSASEMSDDEEVTETSSKKSAKKKQASSKANGKPSKPKPSAKNRRQSAASKKAVTKPKLKGKPKKAAERKGRDFSDDDLDQGLMSESSGHDGGGGGSESLRLRFSFSGGGVSATSPVRPGGSPDHSGGSWSHSGRSGIDHLLNASALDAEEDKRIAQEVVESGRASPSAQDAIAGMLSIGRTGVNPFPGLTSSSSSSSSSWPSQPSSSHSPHYGSTSPPYQPVASSSLLAGCGSLMASASLANPLMLASASGSPSKSKVVKPSKKLEPYHLAEGDSSSDESDEDPVKEVHEDDEFVYTALDDSDSEADPSRKRKHSGKRAKSPDDSNYNPRTKVPSAPKSGRPHREGTQKTWAEKGFEEARKASTSSASTSDGAGPSRGSDSDSDRRLPAAFLLNSPALLGGSVRIDPKPGFRTAPAPKSPAAASGSQQRRPKKGMATAKQRLGKILKIHKMLY